MASPRSAHLATQKIVERYMRDVETGARIAGKLEQLAVARQRRDLAEAKSRRLRFDPKAAHRAVSFFGLLKHSKGEWAGRPFELAPWQAFVTWCAFGWKRADGTRRYRSVYVEIARKNGKTTWMAGVGIYLAFFDDEPGAEVYAAAPLDLETPVATPDGWTTMGAIGVGDRVFDETGTPRNVVGVSDVFNDRDCFAVRFSDGSSVVTDAEHLWTVDSLELGESKAGLPRGVSPRFNRTISTEKIAATLKTSWGTTNHRIGAAGALQCSDVDLPIPPYTLGAWLGDGRSNRGAIGHAADDLAIQRGIEAEGFEVSFHCSTPAMVNYTVRGLRTLLREQGLLDNKHIPSAYLRAPIKARLSLIRGLMDTDGCCTSTGEVRFTNGNEKIARGMYELLASVGIVPNIRETRSASGAPHWVVACRGNGEPLFSLPRKAARQAVPTRRARNRYIVAVEPVPSRPVRCISVDSPSHLFLVGHGMIPTHNTKRDQARICHGEAVRMVRSAPGLGVATLRDNLHRVASAQKFEPLGSDADTTDGLNIHGVIIDEYHAHRTRDLRDRLDTAMGARRQPQGWTITTAGDDELSPCFQDREIARAVLEGTIDDDTLLAFIASPDEKDDWTEESTWSKGNPNLGISVKLDALRDEANSAMQSPAKQNAFRRFRLNQWTRATTRFLDLAKWDACAGPLDPRALEDALAGGICYGGLDLSSKSDLTAFVLVFPPEDVHTGVFDVVSRFWLPEAALTRPDRPRNVPLEQWAEEGHLILTPGEAIDHAFIFAELEQLYARYRIHDVNFDRWGSDFVRPQLEEIGLLMVQFGQGFKDMSEPTKQLEALVLKQRLRHGGHPILRWNADCLEVATDPAGNLKPVKPDTRKSTKRIDGQVALIMALARAMPMGQSPPGERSVYEDRGLAMVGATP